MNKATTINKVPTSFLYYQDLLPLLTKFSSDVALKSDIIK